MGRRLSWLRRDLAVDPVRAARALLGATVVRDHPEGPVTLRLTEVEAYAGAEDPGSHAFRGRTGRNAVMFGPAGHAYVYFTYGMHWCLNVVCGADGDGAAVLLRAGEVVGGVELARARRPRARDRDLARGPARLATALAVTGEHNGLDLLAADSPLRLVSRAPIADAAVSWGPRVGVSGAGAPTAWRAWLTGDPTVSPYRPAVPRRKPAAPA